MAYQAGLNPPGGVWDKDQKYKSTITHNAGTSILAANNPDLYSRFWLYNTVSFIASLSTIFFLMSGLPLRKKVLMWILMATTWVTIFFVVMTYLQSMVAISQSCWETEEDRSFKMAIHSMDTRWFPVVMYSLYVWLGFVSIVFLVHAIRFLAFVFRNVKDPQKLKKWISGRVSWCRSSGNIKI